jgi:hypothetical protein
MLIPVESFVTTAASGRRNPVQPLISGLIAPHGAVVFAGSLNLADGAFGAVALLTAVSAFAVLAPSLRVPA